MRLLGVSVFLGDIVTWKGFCDDAEQKADLSKTSFEISFKTFFIVLIWKSYL